MEDVLTRPGIGTITEHFNGLPKQPKLEIAQAVGKLGLGIDVPPTHVDLDAAIGSHEPFIARSEHPCELLYSGLAHSIQASPKDPDHKTLRKLDAVLTDNDRDFYSIIDMDVPGRLGFCNAESWRSEAQPGTYNNRDLQDTFARDHSLSYWKLESGTNFFMLADPGQADRYYIGLIHRFPRMMVVQNGSVTKDMVWYDRHRSPTVDAEKLIEFYQTVTDSSLFDSSNAAIIEGIDRGDDSKPIFLQYHPTQPKQYADFEVNRPSEEVYFVKGTTPEEGQEVTFWPRSFEYRDKPLAERLGCTVISGEARAEYYLPVTDLYIPGVSPESKSSSYNRLLVASVNHGTRSMAFKPRLVVGLTEKALDKLCRSDRWTRTKKVWVQADGNSAAVKYYDEETKHIVNL